MGKRCYGGRHYWIKKGVWSWWSKKVVWGGILPWLSEAKVKSYGLPSRSIVPGDFVDKEIHQESTRQWKAMKYLRDSCYHRIEYSVANSLAALMRKWYLNRNFQPYSYSQRLQEGVDGIRNNTSNPIYTWRVEMKEER